MGVVALPPDFLRSLYTLTRHHDALLICDEVISGFRLRYGTVSELMGVKPDLLMLGKIIGGGLPNGAGGGRAGPIDLFGPPGPLYPAGALSREPPSVSPGN